MTDPNTRPVPEPLQFDRAVESSAAAGGAPATPALSCAFCGKPIATSYYNVAGRAACESCKHVAENAIAAQSSNDAFFRAVVFGAGAAIAGAAIYYGVIALLGLEIGIVAILIGYMVGRAIRKGARGGGGRRYQVLAVALTYLSVGLAYAPLAFKGFSIAAVVMVVALPVIAVMGSGASGILSAIIIGVGLRQAWRMTAAHPLTITGPYKVGGSAEHPAPST